MRYVVALHVRASPLSAQQVLQQREQQLSPSSSSHPATTATTVGTVAEAAPVAAPFEHDLEFYRLQTLSQFLRIYSADVEATLAKARGQVRRLLGEDAAAHLFQGRHELFDKVGQ